MNTAYDYRPPELAVLPIAIYYLAFSYFRREMVTSTEDLEFTESECYQAAEFVDASLQLYPGVGPDKAITKEHDEYQLIQLCARYLIMIYYISL